MQQLEQLLDQYGDSHQNLLNKVIHWVCVPVIVWTVVALLWSIPFPGQHEVLSIPVNWATIVLAISQLYYFRLSTALAIGFLIFNIGMLAITIYLESHSPWPLWQLALGVFIIAWIGQFIGHAIEGKRPSFFKDVQFLLIGPAWLLAAFYRTIGLKY